VVLKELPENSKFLLQIDTTKIRIMILGYIVVILYYLNFFLD
jgi:hypothetical protein